ncbi:MAG: ATP-binding protein [Pseudobdellovibrionaceae bacterium]|nr:ATP-binding protein [Pseudobdellovibrionaceae bacterium]
MFVIFTTAPVLHISHFHAAAVVTVISVVSAALLVTAAFRGVMRRQREAYFYASAWTSLLACVVITGLMIFGALPSSFIIQHSLIIGSMLEVIILALALADRMNRMRNDLAQVNQELAQHFANVNQEVKEKTRDIRGMLDNLELGIFAVDQSLHICPDYSRFLDTLIEPALINDGSISRILFEDTGFGSDRRSQVESTIVASLDSDQIAFEGNKHLLPSSLQKIHKDGVKEIELGWSPMVNEEGMVEKLLVAMKDVTHFNLMRKQSEVQNRRIAFLGQYLGVDSHEFVIVTSQLISLCDAVKHQGPGALDSKPGPEQMDFVEQVFAELHTSKAFCRKLGLADLCDSIHDAENYLHSLKSHLERFSEDRIRLALNAIRGRIAEYHDTLQMLGIVQGEAHVGRPKRLESLLIELLSERLGLAKALGKPVPVLFLDAKESVTLDGPQAQALEQAIVHLLRNSMDHGLETDEERRAAGKSDCGSLSIKLVDEGDAWGLTYEDDGRGVNLDLVFAKAVQKGLVEKNSYISEQQVAELIFKSGFSTREEVTDTSGRGVGLDAAARKMLEVGGRLGVELVERLADGALGLWHVRFHLRWPKEGNAQRNYSEAA